MNAPPANPNSTARLTPSELDRSCRWPVLLLFSLSVLWLLPAGGLAVIAAIKRHAPDFLASSAWLTYGRSEPAAWNAWVFGFGFQAALGTCLWLTVRLGRTPLAGVGYLILATLFWNVGVAVGLLGILTGHNTGLEGMEMPLGAAVILFVSYLVMALSVLLTFHRRRESEIYISQWYVIGAVFAFPWFYATAYLLGVVAPLRGVLQAAVQAWFVQGLAVYWFGFVSLAVLFYFLPKMSRRAVPSRHLAWFGFWTLAWFGGLAAMVRYSGGPFPAWMISVSTVAGVLGIFPVVAIGMCLVGCATAPAATADPDRYSYRFAQVALLVFLVLGLLAAVNSLGTVRRITQFTLVTSALDEGTLLGLFSMALFGAMYWIAPRLVQRPWPSAAGVRWHFRLAALAVIVLLVAFLIGGVLQGLALNHPSVPFSQVQSTYLPFAANGTLAQLLFLIGNVLFAVNWVSLLRGRQPSSTTSEWPRSNATPNSTEVQS